MLSVEVLSKLHNCMKTHLQGHAVTVWDTYLSFQLPAPQYGTFSRISSETRLSVLGDILYDIVYNDRKGHSFPRYYHI